MNWLGRKRGGYGARQDARRREKNVRVVMMACAVVVALALIAAMAAGIHAALSPGNDPETTHAPSHSANPHETQGPTYAPDEARALLDARYDEALASEIQITFGENEWRFKLSEMGAVAPSEEDIEPDLTDPAGQPLTLTCERGAIEALAQSIKEAVDCEPVNATMQIIEVEKFTYTDSAVGLRLDAAALADRLEAMIRRGEGGEIALEPEVIEPEVKREDLEGSTLLLGECYTTLEGSSTSRISNVNLALSYFNFKAIGPGKRVSFNRVVGKRSEETGFKEAPEYAGTTIQTGYGGGTCQASTTIYGAVMRAGLDIVERYPHTMTVGYVPGSQDAAVSDNKDFRFRNNTESTIYVFAYLDPVRNCAVCKIYGKPIDPNVYIDIESVILQSDIGGTSISFMDDVEGKRVWYKDDPPVLYKTGKPGMRSEAYRVYRDVSTGAELRREKLSTDYYQPESDTYLRGIHDR